MTENTMNLNLKNLKVNLHITKAYNYRCRYCFAQFKHHDLPLESWKRIIDNLKASGMVTKINFAGGEPLVYPHFAELVDYAYAQGFELSIITNGSLLLNEKCFPRRLFKKISMLGTSVDSMNPEILRKLKTRRKIFWIDRKGANKSSPTARNEPWGCFRQICLVLDS